MPATFSALLIGDGKGEVMGAVSHMLLSRGWRLDAEVRVSDALSRMTEQSYQLVLAGLKIDRTARNALVIAQAQAGLSLFFGMARGTWWLPVVVRGRPSVDVGAVSYETFVEDLEYLRCQLERDHQTVDARRVRALVFRGAMRDARRAEAENALLLQV